MSVLVIAQAEGGECHPATLSAITAATQLSDSVDLLIAGTNIDSMVKQAIHIPPIRKVLVMDHECYEHNLAEPMADLIAHCAQNYSTLIAGSTTFAKDVLPRAAALLNIAPITDIIAIENASTFVRPMYAGNIMATVKTNQSQNVITIRPTVFDRAKGVDSHQAERVTLDYVVANSHSGYVKTEKNNQDSVDLQSAEVVISGGRGVKDADTFKRLAVIAEKLGAAIGASRAAVDAGLAPNDWQVGQTGKVVAPTLYIAVGISGAIQHCAGMKDSKIIVAINKDPDAPIFEIADYGLVADVQEVLAQWEALL